MLTQANREREKREAVSRLISMPAAFITPHKRAKKCHQCELTCPTARRNQRLQRRDRALSRTSDETSGCRAAPDDFTIDQYHQR